MAARHPTFITRVRHTVHEIKLLTTEIKLLAMDLVSFVGFVYLLWLILKHELGL